MLTQQKTIVRHVLKTFALFLLVVLYAEVSFAGIKEDTKRTDYFKQPTENEIRVSTTKYDYTDFAKKITSDSKNDYDKIKSIYQWICSNIEYDTSYSIHSADSCIEAGKGVCQAYCELFYRLAEAVGVKVEIISGKSRNNDGIVSPSGHAWLLAYTRKNHGILLDPTWGAGSVDGSVFTRSANPWTWFNVRPEWMILSHFPEDESYQLIRKPLSIEDFASLPPVNDLWVEYGFMDEEEIFKRAKKNALSFPEFYTGGEGMFEIIDFPTEPTLRIGDTYTFRVRIKKMAPFAIAHNSIYCDIDEWKNEGNGIYSTLFMPRDTGTVSFALRDKANRQRSNLVKYYIQPPTRKDWEKVERLYPLDIPEAREVKNLYSERWSQVGIDNHKLVQLIKEQQVRELPILFTEKGQKLKVVSVPMNKHLKVGKSYTFRFYPQAGLDWAIVAGEEWLREWTKADDGIYSMTITPKEAGDLALYVQLDEGKKYWQCLVYEVIN